MCNLAVSANSARTSHTTTTSSMLKIAKPAETDTRQCPSDTCPIGCGRNLNQVVFEMTRIRRTKKILAHAANFTFCPEIDEPVRTLHLTHPHAVWPDAPNGTGAERALSSRARLPSHAAAADPFRSGR